MPRGTLFGFSGVYFIFTTVMPVPDQVRDDGPGIQKTDNLKMDWIPE